MTDEQIALGRRAVACKGWRWLPGTRTTDAMRVIHDPDRWPDRPCAIREGSWVDTSPPRPLGDALPDLEDPATLGCLLALVREACAVPFLQVSVKISREHGYQFDCHPHHRGQWVDSEAEALVAALEEAP
jgi:hypothetical protein